MKTIKKVFLNSLLLVFSTLIPVCGFCFQNEPDGFGGIQWGTHISAVTNMILVLEKANDPIRGDLKIYQNQDQVMTEGRAKLKKVGYVYFKDKFMSAQILTEGSINWLGLKDGAFEIFGKGEQPDQSIEQYFWFGNKSRIILNYDKNKEQGSLSVLSTQYLSQYQESIKQVTGIMGLYGR
jgi:hypothetical protein